MKNNIDLELINEIILSKENNLIVESRSFLLILLDTFPIGEPFYFKDLIYKVYVPYKLNIRKKHLLKNLIKTGYIHRQFDGNSHKQPDPLNLKYYLYKSPKDNPYYEKFLLKSEKNPFYATVPLEQERMYVDMYLA